MHIVPLGKEGQLPLKILGEKNNKTNGNFFAITENGRISAFPAEWKTVLVDKKYVGYVCTTETTIESYLDDNYPNKKNVEGKKQKQFILTCVMYGNEKFQKLIFDVVGFSEKLKEIEYLYKALGSLNNSSIGDYHWKEVEVKFSSEPMRSWINNLITTLKSRGWNDFVRRGIEG